VPPAGRSGAPVPPSGQHGGVDTDRTGVSEDSSPPFPAGPVVTVFRSRLRGGAGQEYGALAERMLALARAVPGFVDFKTFVAEDGERVSLVTFADLALHRAWREHPAHQEAQRVGRERLYDAFEILVCTVQGARHFRAPG